jgi:hypothetical protein
MEKMAGSGWTLTSSYRFTGTLQVLALDLSSVQAQRKKEKPRLERPARGRATTGEEGRGRRDSRALGAPRIRAPLAASRAHGVPAAGSRRPVAEINWRQAAKD